MCMSSSQMSIANAHFENLLYNFHAVRIAILLGSQTLIVFCTGNHHIGHKHSPFANVAIYTYIDCEHS